MSVFGLLSSLRNRLLLLVLVALIPALMLTLYNASEHRRHEAFEVQRDALHLAREISTQHERIIQGARLQLITLARYPQVRGGDGAACSALFADLLRQFPFYLNISAARVNGDVFCSALPLKRPVNVAGQDVFQRALSSKGFEVSEFQIGPISGKPELTLVYPSLDESGLVRGVIRVGLDLTAFGMLSGESRIHVAGAMLPELPGGSTLTVRDRNGRVLARLPDSEGWLGKIDPGEPAVAAILKQKAEGTTEAVGSDGVRRLYVFTRLSGPLEETGMSVSVAIPAAAAFADVNRARIRSLFLMGLLAAAVLGAAWVFANLFVLRHTEALTSATRRLGAGDLSARTGLPLGSSELGQLARAFDDMAAGLQRRKAEAEQAAEEIRALNAELEQRVAERTAQLEAANRELEAFSYSVAHDLRAPLRALHGFARILAEEHAPHLAAEARRYLGLVQSNAKQMGDLVDDLLTLSRLGRQPLNKQRVEPAKIVRQVLGDLQSEEEGREVEFRTGDLPTCEADPVLLKQVYLNLVSNALKFSRKQDKAVIEIGCRGDGTPGERVYFVKDNGVGFDMRYANKLFGVFQRLHRAEDYEGTGVGLAIVERVIRRHGGRVWAEAEPNKGAAFYFTV